jgi:hypothetical protein
MPDPAKQSISATQAPGLFGVSPYVTRWMLYKHFADGVPLDQDENERMSWGKKMQPLVLDQAAGELRLEVRPHDETYIRKGVLGATRDATIICPDRGPGTVETKCVFDYGVWMRDWAGGKSPPRHYEIQTQVQMLVGDGAKPYEWGVLAAWVCGEIHYFERKPIPQLWDNLADEARAFFADVEAKREPDPFGVPVEVPWLTELLPTVAGNVLDLTAAADAGELAEAVRQYRYNKDSEAAHRKTAETLRAKLLGTMRDAEEAILPDGIRVRVSTRHTPAATRKAFTSKTLNVFVPDDTAASAAIPLEELRYAG